MSKFKAHVIYKNSEGKRVPGVTTITGELGWSKGVLINWANRKGLEGIDTKKYVDDKADIGTLAHLIITNQLQGIKTNMDDYSKNQIKAALNSVKSFDAWAKDKKIIPILIEEPLAIEVNVSNSKLIVNLGYGGTLDIFARINGKQELIDLKTGKAIYDEHIIQVGGGYYPIATRQGYVVDSVRILNIPRSKNEKFEDLPIEPPALASAQRIFLNCLYNYQLHKELRKEL